MQRYNIHFWNTPIEDIVQIEATSTPGILEYLYNNEKQRIYKIMKINNELTLWRNNESVLLWNNEYSGSLWFDIDKCDLLHHRDKPPFLDGYCTLPEIGIDELSFEQFCNLIKLMLRLCDDYGDYYLLFEDVT